MKVLISFYNAGDGFSPQEADSPQGSHIPKKNMLLIWFL